MQGLEIRVWGLELQGLGFRVQTLNPQPLSPQDLFASQQASFERKRAFVWSPPSCELKLLKGGYLEDYMV